MKHFHGPQNERTAFPPSPFYHFGLLRQKNAFLRDSGRARSSGDSDIPRGGFHFPGPWNVSFFIFVLFSFSRWLKMEIMENENKTFPDRKWKSGISAFPILPLWPTQTKERIAALFGEGALFTRFRNYQVAVFTSGQKNVSFLFPIVFPCLRRIFHFSFSPILFPFLPFLPFSFSFFIFPGRPMNEPRPR